MKILILFLSYIISTFCVAQHSSPRFVKLTIDEQNDLKQTFNWNDEKILLLNIVPPIKFSDSYSEDIKIDSLKSSGFYKEVNLLRIDNKFVYSSCTKSNQKIESDLFIIDKKEIIARIFFARSQAPCYGIILIRTDGEFRIITSEYSSSAIKILIEELTN